MVDRTHYDPKNCVFTVDGVKVDRRDSDGETVRVQFDAKRRRARNDKRRVVRNG